METLELVTPTRLDGFCGSKFAIKCIEDFIKGSKAGDKNIIGILGPDGCGKTTLCRLLFKKYNYNVLEIGKDTLHGDDIKTTLNNYAKNNTIESLMNKRDKVVFVDDVDILTNVDKFILSKIIGLNKLFIDKKIKVFMTCNINDERKLTDHNKDIEVFKLHYPSFKDSYVYIMNVFDNHDVEYEPEELLNVSAKCKGNIRETVLNYGVSADELDTKHSERTFKDMNNFEVAKYVLQKRAKWNDIDVLSKSDVGIIPYLMYENIPDEVEANYKMTGRGKKAQFLDLYLAVNKCFIDASEFEESAFTNHEWSLLGYGNYLKVHSIYNTLSSLERKANVKDVKYRFSQMVSKISHKNIMNKKVKSISNTANVSSASIIMASDMHASGYKKEDGDKPRRKSKSKVSKNNEMGADGGCATVDIHTLKSEFDFEDGVGIMSTYQKYFT